MNFSEYLDPMETRPYGAMPDAEYHGFPALSATVLKKRTQAEMLHEKVRPLTESTEALTFGSLLHAAVLEPWKFQTDEFAKHFVLFTETKSLDTKAADRAREENPGKLVVSPEMFEHAAEMRRLAIEQNPRAVDLLTSPDGMKEAALIGYDAAFQVRRKIKVDYLPRLVAKGNVMLGNYLLDIKTTRAHVADFETEAWRNGYWLQAAYYLDTHEILTGHRPDWFHFLVVSKEPPVMARIYSMQNLPPSHPLYEKSKLSIARRTLGLDPSASVGRIAMFTAAAAEHSMTIGDRDASPAELRNVWTAYEQAEPVAVL